MSSQVTSPHVMSPHDVPPGPPGSNPPQFYPVYPAQFHPEFGYLAPTIRFRRKMSLLGKGAAFGAILGAIAAIAMLPDPDVRVGTALSIQSQAAPGDELRSPPVAFVAPTLALPAAALRSTPMPSATAPAAVTAAPPSAPAAAQDATDVKPAPRAKKKVARQPRQPRNARAAESDPRSAYAGPYRQSRDPRRGLEERRPFGFGW